MFRLRKQIIAQEGTILALLQSRIQIQWQRMVSVKNFFVLGNLEKPKFLFSLQNYKNALLKFSVYNDVLGDLKRANAPSNQLRGTDTNQDASRGHNHRNDHQKKSSVSPTSLSSAISSLSSPSANSSTSSSSSTSSIDNSSSHRSSKNHKKGE